MIKYTVKFTKERPIAVARVGAVLLPSVLLAIFYSRDAHSAEAPQLPASVVKALARNASELDPLSVTWTRTRSTSLSARELLTKIKGEHNWSFLQPFHVLFQWQSGCAYLRNSSKSTLAEPIPKEPAFGWDTDLNLVMSVNEMSFDGECLYSGNGALPDTFHSPGLIITPLEQLESQTGQLCYPEFLGHAGLAFPYSGSDLATPPSSSILRVLQQGGSLVRVQDTSVNRQKGVLVDMVGKGRWPQTDETHSFSYQLLPEYGYAVCRWEERTPDGKILRSVENGDFMKVPGTEVYLPKRSVVEYYTWVTIPTEVTSQPLLQETFTVENVDTRPIDNRQFCLREAYEKPGTQIADYKLGKGPHGFGVQYRIPANPEDLDRVIEAATSQDPYHPVKGRRFVLALALTSIPLTLLALFLWRRHGRSS